VTPSRPDAELDWIARMQERAGWADRAASWSRWDAAAHPPVHVFVADARTPPAVARVRPQDLLDADDLRDAVLVEDGSAHGHW
jgi:hypothetical protein